MRPNQRFVTGAFLALALGAAVGCDEKSAVAKQPPVPTNQFIVGIDLSASRSVESMRDARRLLDNLVDTRLQNGDELVLLEMYGGSDTGDHQWVDSVPNYRAPGKVSVIDQRHLEDFRSDAHQVIAAMFDAKRVRKIENTDVFGTLARAADYAKAARGRRPMLLLLSDMVQSTPGLRMERESAIPGSVWIERRQSEGTLPDLRGICVVVGGAPAATSHEARIRDFWFHYFASAGVRIPESNYRAFIADASELHC